MLYMDVTYRYMGNSYSLEMAKERPFFVYVLIQAN